MNIQPVQPVSVLIFTEESELSCTLVELTEVEMVVNSGDYVERETIVRFKSRFFHGNAIVKEFSYKQYLFTYTLKIQQINYQPGLVVNTKL